MSDETKKTKEHPVLDMIFRLVNVYLAVTFFLNGWGKLQNQEYLLAASWFIISLSSIAQVFGWFQNKSKAVTTVIFIPLIFALIVILASQWL